MLRDIKKAIDHLRREGVWVLAGRSYVMALSLVSSIIYARLFSEEQYGIYRYLTAILAIAAFFSLPEAYQVVVRYVPRGFIAVYEALLESRRRWTWLASFVLLCLAANQAAIENRSLALTLIVLAVIAPTYYPYQLYEALLQATSDFKWLNLLYIKKATLQVVLVLAAWWATSNIYLAAVVSTAGMAVFFLAASKSVAKKHTSTEVLAGGALEFNYKREALMLSLASALPLLSENLDKVIVASKVSYSALAIYAVGTTVGTAANGFAKPFMVTLSSRLVHRELTHKQYFILLVAGTVGGFALAEVATIVIPVVYGEAYSGSSLYAGIVLKSMGLYFLATLYYNQSMFFKGSTIGRVIASNTLVPLFSLTIMYLSIRLVDAPENILTIFAILYPVKLVLSCLIMWSFARVRDFTRRGTDD